MTITDLDFTRMDETELSALAAPTEVHTRAVQAPQLAWSEADVEDFDDYQPDHTTRWLGFYVAILAALIAVLAAVWLHESRPAPTQTRATPVISTPLDTVIVSPPVAAPETPDKQFLDLMAGSGWDMTKADPPTLINAAHTICTRIAAGETDTAILKDLKQGTPEITHSHAQALIDNAETIYCPK